MNKPFNKPPRITAAGIASAAILTLTLAMALSQVNEKDPAGQAAEHRTAALSFDNVHA